jgi:photosystem II stability/assembly factor-like uncharacterized protein
VHRLIVRLVFFLLLLNGSARAHDPSSYGGVFRSRDLGGSWLNADVGLFLNAALVVAVDPGDPSHLVIGTDLGILSSRSGGRSWRAEAGDLIFGAVFAVAFSSDGMQLSCAGTSGVFRREGDRWRRVRAPDAALPARALITGDDEIYLLGRTGLFVSRDGGLTFSAVPGLPDSPEMTALTLVRMPQETLVAVVDGRVMTSQDRGIRWRDGGLGDEGAPVDTVASDPVVPGRVWAASADRILLSDDLGASWRAVGRRLPETATKVRGIAANAQATALVVTTDRGTYTSENGGESWLLKQDNLPAHLEAGPLARDPSDPQVIYAVYSLIPYSEVWRSANEGTNMLARLDPMSLAGGVSFFLLILIAGGVVARQLARRRTVIRSPR